MLESYYCWAVDIPFLVKNNLPTTTHLSAPFHERRDSLLVQSAVMSGFDIYPSIHLSKFNKG